MAIKRGTSFDKDQTAALAAGVTGICNAMDSAWAEVDKAFKMVEGDDVLGESDTKTALLESIKNTREAYVAVQDKLNRMAKAIETVCETTGVNVNKNIQSTDEATQVISAAAKKAAEATGSNA